MDKNDNNTKNFQKPKISSLPGWYRKIFFWFLFALFIIILPFLFFYTTGYRLDLTKDKANLVITGGIYVGLDKLDTDVYVDNKPIKQPRIFRSAYYIQNLSSGLHRVVVQGNDLQTWVKDLPVYPYLVTKVSVFNMPLVPQVRLVSKYLTDKNKPIFNSTDDLSVILDHASSTYDISTATPEKIKKLALNEEYNFIFSLFKKSSTTKKSVLSESYYLSQDFRFATTAKITNDDFVHKDNIVLYPEAGELWAEWVGNKENIPYYFCVINSDSNNIKENYGDHVGSSIEKEVRENISILVNDRLCRTKIRVDRKNMDVYFYDFLPGYSDLILLQMEDGLYVTEIDDRSWQNTQLLYPGKDFRVIVYNNSIFVKDKEFYFEILTKVETK